jgi:hypothetical protein
MSLRRSTGKQKAQTIETKDAPLAQLAEQLTLNQWVPGSSPGGCTMGKQPPACGNANRGLFCYATPRLIQRTLHSLRARSPDYRETRHHFLHHRTSGNAPSPLASNRGTIRHFRLSPRSPPAHSPRQRRRRTSPGIDRASGGKLRKVMGRCREGEKWAGGRNLRRVIPVASQAADQEKIRRDPSLLKL